MKSWPVDSVGPRKGRYVLLGGLGQQIARTMPATAGCCRRRASCPSRTSPIHSPERCRNFRTIVALMLDSEAALIPHLRVDDDRAGHIYTITLEDLVRAVDDSNHRGACRGTLSSLFNAETLRRSRSAPVGPEVLRMTAEEFFEHQARGPSKAFCGGGRRRNGCFAIVAGNGACAVCPLSARLPSSTQRPGEPSSDCVYGPTPA
jgi:hypothetical protein